MIEPLPVIEDCSDCGACCQQTPIPPFLPAEEITRNVPQRLLTVVKQRIQDEQHFDLLPCVWFDTVKRICKHYEYRPQACRTFEVGSDACRAARRLMQLE